LNKPDRHPSGGLIRAVAVAIGLVVLGAALELAYGAHLGDVSLYAAYELGFVLLPGVLAVRVLRPTTGSLLPTLAFGWALGYVLEVLFFNLTAAIGARDLFLAYPIVVIACAGFALRRRVPDFAAVREAVAISRGQLWAIGGACAVAMLYLGLPFFSVTRLPGDGSIVNPVDFSWAVSLAADLMNHWPLGDPNVSGDALPYHFFFSAHLAAASQVTGIGVPVVFFRLFVLPMVVCLVLQFVASGMTLFKSATVGVIASGLTLFAGEIQLDPRRSLFFQLPFAGAMFTLLVASPSFLFGLVLFVPLIALIGELLRRDAGRPEVMSLVLIGLFMAGVSDAKVTILPVIIFALGLYGAFVLWRERRISRATVAVGAMAVVVEAVVYLLQYRGNASGVQLDVTAGIDFVQSMPAVSLVKDGLESLSPTFPGSATLISILVFPLGLFGLLGPQLAGLLFIRRSGGPVDHIHAWLFALLATGVISLFLLTDAAGEGYQLYFFFYGLAAGCILSAAGLHGAWQERPRSLPGRRLTYVAIAVVGAVGGLIALPLLLGHPDAADGNARMYLAWYGGLVVLLIAFYALLRRRASRWRLIGAEAILVCAAIVALGFIDTPVDRVVPAVIDRPPAVADREGATPDLLQALSWVREETPTDSVVAVSNPGLFNFDYAAYGERRLFLGGWGYSQRSRDAGYGEVAAGRVNPFANRLALNDAVFRRADPDAARTLADDFSVDYLFIDRVNGPVADLGALSDLGTRVFENPDAAVFEIG
jgi:hypothetical protein